MPDLEIPFTLDNGDTVYVSRGRFRSVIAYDGANRPIGMSDDEERRAHDALCLAEQDDDGSDALYEFRRDGWAVWSDRP